MSKGSKRRPSVVDRKTYAENYDRIFGKKKFNVHSSGKKETIAKAGVKQGVDMGTWWPRPSNVPMEQVKENYERVFGKE